VSYYQNVFASQPLNATHHRVLRDYHFVVRTRLTPKKFEFYDIPLSLKDISQALFQMDNDKYRNLYGYHGGFYKDFWDIIGTKLFKFY